MTPVLLVWRSLRYYWRTHLGVVLGTMLATLVLTGALFVGDSVKATLRQQAEARVGRVEDAFVAGERFVSWPDDAAERRKSVAGMFEAGPDAAAILLVQGTVVRPDQSARANRVQVVGVDDAFWKLSPAGNPVPLPEGQVAVNPTLASQLGLAVGDDVLLRLEKPSAFSKDAPLSGEESDTVSIRANVARLVEDADFGRFALTSGQVPPPSVFLARSGLQERLDLHGKVNVVLNPARNKIPESPISHVQNTNLLADADAEIRELPSNLGLELRTSRVFLDPAIIAAARKNESAHSGSLPPGLDALTYFVNELRVGDVSDPNARATPYSMVTALDAPASGFIPAELAEDEMTITRWLADDLGIDVGAKVTISYFVMGERRQLIEKSRTFIVLGPILEMNEPQLNTSWMPDFPNVPDKDSFSNWRPGFPFDSTRIRKKDEEYWEKYRGTPKAFVNLRVGKEMWSNRWGNLTSIRYPTDASREQLEKISSYVEPTALGFRVVPLRKQALVATDAPVDFGQLFAGFSFFLILAAAVLTGLLFTFSIEQRTVEAGLLLAVGWPIKQVRRLFLREGLALALFGSVLGAMLAAVYTQLVLRALSGIWSGATGGTHFLFAPAPATFGLGIAIGIVVAVLAMWLASRRLFKRDAANLLAGSAHADDSPASAKTARARWWPWISRMLEIGALASAVYLLTAQPNNPIVFFIVGFLCLMAGLSLSLRRLGTFAHDSSDLPSTHALAIRNTSRRRGRSLATIGVLASGVFMVVAVDSFRKGPLEDPTRRESGTGGFSLVGETSSPIYEDLNSAKGREQYSLDDDLLKDVHIVQMRIREGDDASCLNLNRALQPRIVGVPLVDLDGRFGAADKSQWSKLLEPSKHSTQTVQALVDANTLQWAMQKKLGDVLDYIDERGQTRPFRLTATFPASILQGLVIIDESNFTAIFPNTAGYSMFLVDCPPAKLAAVRDHLSKQLSDRGLELVAAADRLSTFNAVENTYLSIFQVLGGLGLLLGSAGLGIVVARNVLERRSEFGLLEAVGFTPRQLRSLVFAEHRWLIILALGIGTISALVAVWPNLAQKSGGFPWFHSTALLLGMALLGTFWTWFATRLSLRGSLLTALRTE